MVVEGRGVWFGMVVHSLSPSSNRERLITITRIFLDIKAEGI